MGKIIIAGKEFVSAAPTFMLLDLLKDETGMDFALGMSTEKSKEIVTDMKKMSRVMALITKHNDDEIFDEKKVESRMDFFYKNGTIVDFKNVLGFFSQVLSGKESNTTEVQSVKEKEKEPKTKMKLVTK